MLQATPPERLDKMRHWIAQRQALAPSDVSLRLAAGDASFRRYFRLTLPDGGTRMVMDAPPFQESDNTLRFVTIAQEWRRAGLPVPHLYIADQEAGFVELEDLGDTALQQNFTGIDDPATLAWHERAIELLERLQSHAPIATLPPYDEALLGRELDLFPEWCLERLLGITPPSTWHELRQTLIDDALRQPSVAVHRDFDAMNLMVRDDALYLIDFQDAVAGPLTYDLISLLRGRYCRFNEARYAAWIEAFRRRAIADGRLDSDIDTETFRYLADAMAAQRSLKVLGIFCRLTLRDNKAGYLARLPHFLAHLQDSLAPWPVFDDVSAWLVDSFAPALNAELQCRGITTGGAS
ncbi:aminoglycoside phosphotransferase [Litchfieldella qijiaojingensis]|uniref:Aminoglycoside phosphotransferase n=1 Tax=Litchfieldella qijiaojingensis TaxID=980347 RepID=A0ABQ2YZ67_9GAMM|nr:phosphotransferase [Halomonas qijiaojingensis]GGY00169.1 aminoglycoside phosphotransferase [Halomonas qijiaojingensis]